MHRTILFATRNPHKVQLFAPVFAGHGLTCVTLRDIEPVERPLAETGSTADKPAAPAKGKAKVSRSSAKAAN